METLIISGHKSQVGEPLVFLLHLKCYFRGGHLVGLRESSCVAYVVALIDHTTNGPLIAYLLKSPYLSHFALVAFVTIDFICVETSGEYTRGVSDVANDVVFVFNGFKGCIRLLANFSLNIIVRYICNGF